MSPLSPGGPASCRRLQELYGFFQTGGPLGRTNTEGQDDLLAQVRPSGAAASSAPVPACVSLPEASPKPAPRPSCRLSTRCCRV